MSRAKGHVPFFVVAGDRDEDHEYRVAVYVREDGFLHIAEEARKLPQKAFSEHMWGEFDRVELPLETARLVAIAVLEAVDKRMKGPVHISEVLKGLFPVQQQGATP